MEELSTLRELKLRLEEPQAREGPDLPHWALRDERFRCLLREAQRQVRARAPRGRFRPRALTAALSLSAPQAGQSKQEQRQEEAAERRLRKASKEVLQMRGQSQKEPLPVQTFRLAFCWGRGGGGRGCVGSGDNHRKANAHSRDIAHVTIGPVVKANFS